MKTFLQFIREFSYREISHEEIKDELWQEVQSMVGTWKGSNTSSRIQATQGGIVVYFNGKFNFATGRGDALDLERTLGKKYKDVGGNFELKISDFDKENDQGWITILVG